MTDTANLGLPCIEGSQAQKHVTHNDALRMLDTLVQLAVLDRDLTAPPASPADGERWIVKAGATDVWAGHDNAIAAWQDGAWQFCVPQLGWLAYIIDESVLLAWNGSDWISAVDALTPTALNNMTLLGVGTTADATNPFSTKLNNTLFTAKTVAEGGDGDLRYKLSKEAAANTASFLFQDAYSGRAEIGLTGDDDFHFKVSADGTTWRDAIVIDKATGSVSMPNTSGTSGDLDLTLAELSLGVADALNTAQFIGASGNRFADSFDALTYVDTASATNLDSGVAGLLKPASTAGTQHATSGPTGTESIGFSYIMVNKDLTVTNSAVVESLGTYSTSAFSFYYYIVERVDATHYDIVAKSPLHSHPGGGWADIDLASPYTVPASGTFYVGVAASTSATHDYLNTSAGRVTIGSSYDQAVGTGISATESAAEATPARWTEAGATGDLIVTSAALTAASAPVTARLVARVEEIDAITLNTDLIFSVSRDGGTTWTDFTVMKKFTANSIAVYESDSADISGQPSGTSVKWKATSANNKNFTLNDIYLYWS